MQKKSLNLGKGVVFTCGLPPCGYQHRVLLFEELLLMQEENH